MLAKSVMWEIAFGRTACFLTVIIMLNLSLFIGLEPHPAI